MDRLLGSITTTDSKRDALASAASFCDREIARCYAEVMEKVDPAGALLGLQDWLFEKSLIQKEIAELERSVN